MNHLPLLYKVREPAAVWLSIHNSASISLMVVMVTWTLTLRSDYRSLSRALTVQKDWMYMIWRSAQTF